MERFVSNGSGAAGSSKSILNLFQNVASPLTRMRLYDCILGCGQATADATAEFYIGRTTAQGTAGSSYTPNNLDPGGPGGESSAGQGVFSGEPTYTSNKDLPYLPCHQRNTVRWVCPEGSEIVIPATQNNGLGLRSNQGTSTATYRGTFFHKE
jgi:hypothetical protein